jgi:hypothetical protein
MEYTFWSTADLVEALQRECQSFVLISNIFDEDVGPNGTKTYKTLHGKHTMQCLGLASRVQHWLENKLDDVNSDCNNSSVANNDDNDDNKKGKELIKELNSRCSALVTGIVFNNSEVFLFQKDCAYGQSLGLSIELHRWIQRKYE